MYDYKKRGKQIKFLMGSSPKNRFEFEGNEIIIDILNKCDGSKDIELIAEELSLISEFDKNDLLETIEDLMNKNILFDATQRDIDKTSRYSRQQSFLSSLGVDEHLMLEQIQNRTILLIGMGGIGCWVLANLASCGIKKFVGIDNDVLEISNLSRQIIYQERDLGKYKVDLAKKWVSNYNSDLEFINIKARINSTEDVLGYLDSLDSIDMVVLSADSPSCMLSYVHNACKKKNIPYIQAGYIDEVGSCGPLVTDFSTNVALTVPNEEKAEKSTQEKIDNINSQQITPVLCPVVALVSSYASKQIIKYFLGCKDIKVLNKRIYFNFDDTETIFEFKKEE